MSETRTPPRFSRDEAARILERAADLQARQTAGPGGLSLPELERAAQEVGIDAALVRRAARDMQTAPDAQPTMFGIPTRILLRKSLTVRLDREGLASLANRLDAFFDAHGDRSLTSQSLSWGARHIHVIAEVDEDGTEIQISERFVNTVRAESGVFSALGVMWGMGAAVIVANAMALGSGMALGLSLVGAAAALPLSRIAVRRRHRFRLARVQRQFEAALEQVARPLELRAGAHDGNDDDTDGSPSTCTPAYLGDGLVYAEFE